MTNSTICGKKVLLTAGPTREAIDPVRYISNHSSGKMGYAIAEELLQQGAEVILISGPVCMDLKHPLLTVVKVNSATEMYSASYRYFEQADVAVFAAAVADYRPEDVAVQKIKKDESSFSLKMVKNADIAAEFGKVKTAKQLSVGFALETNDEFKHALNKLDKKNFDMVILNSMNDTNATFGHDTNKITVIRKDFSRTSYSLKNKKEVAADIVHEINTLLSIKELVEEELIEYETMYW